MGLELQEMRIKISYLVIVSVSILILVIGNKLVSSNVYIFQSGSHEVVRAKVQTVSDRIEPQEADDMPFHNTRIIFDAKISSGSQKGNVVSAAQNQTDFAGVTMKDVKKGDSILLINYDNEWFFNGYYRMGKLLGLGIVFSFCVLLFGGKKGFNTLLSLCLTFGAIFAVFIPSILSGKNIYIMSILVCIYTTIMTLAVVIGINKKSFAAAIGCISGIIFTGLLTVIMNRVLLLTGIVDEHSRYLANLPVANSINLRAIIFAAIIIGAMGAIMDVAMSISSALWEIKEKARHVTFETLFRSGLNIGRDVFGTMANTLVLAYIGTSLSVVLILAVYSNSLQALLNMEMIVVEILQALAGSFGILLTMPLTAFFCAYIYLYQTKRQLN